ncbi:HNH endonuclease, partial [bacterium]|nr:HNH endonuclease [bacterium]
PFPDSVARHLDDNPLNNYVENLMWGSSSENTLDKYANGYISGRRLFTIEEVRAIRLSPLPTSELAKTYNVSRSTILRVKNYETYKNYETTHGDVRNNDRI